MKYSALFIAPIVLHFLPFAAYGQTALQLDGSGTYSTLGSFRWQAAKPWGDDKASCERLADDILKY